ncbi:MAG: MOSC domain-containing protein, partial [Microcoleus sp. T3-bin5]|nr:MOSC domain-containing protein [Microcoleus sp. T3-bin5]
FLLIGQASLDDLNGRLAEALPMNRFRPSLVVNGADPYAEESWREMMIGECRFYGVKPCARCTVTTTNQETAQVGKEPLRTLATYRKAGNKILFGQNMVFGREGKQIKVGDQISVLSFNN